jgi:hypothetical protein
MVGHPSFLQGRDWSTFSAAGGRLRRITYFTSNFDLIFLHIFDNNDWCIEKCKYILYLPFLSVQVKFLDVPPVVVRYRGVLTRGSKCFDSRISLRVCQTEYKKMKRKTQQIKERTTEPVIS